MNPQGHYFSVLWEPKEVEIMSDFCVVFYRTKPNQRLKLQHLVMLLLRPHWLKTHLEVCLWSDSQDQMASHSPHLHFFRSV